MAGCSTHTLHYSTELSNLTPIKIGLHRNLPFNAIGKEMSLSGALQVMKLAEQRELRVKIQRNATPLAVVNFTTSPLIF